MTKFKNIIKNKNIFVTKCKSQCKKFTAKISSGKYFPELICPVRWVSGSETNN
jgi:hypothetical protein